MGKGSDRCFLTKDIHLAGKHITTCSTSLIIKERQIKTSVTYNLILRRKKKKKEHKAEEEAEKHWTRLWRNWKPCALCTADGKIK